MRTIMSEAKKRITTDELDQVSGGRTEEDYFAQAERFGMIDTDAHLYDGKTCGDCGWGKLRFERYQPGPFGNREGVYYCSTCHEYTVTVLRD